MKILQHCDNESTAKFVIFIKKYREKTQENKEKEKYTNIYRKYKNAETPVITKIRKTQPLPQNFVWLLLHNIVYSLVSF